MMLDMFSNAAPPQHKNVIMLTNPGFTIFAASKIHSFLTEWEQIHW